MKVLYTAYAHPDGAAALYPDKRADPTRLRPRLREGGLRRHRATPERPGDDGARRGAHPGPGDPRRGGLQGNLGRGRRGVRNMLLQIGEDNVLAGLSGPISFDGRGNPENKPMALVELSPDRTRRYVYRGTVTP
ncbi:hypothetical protein NKH77_42225 [Streptomyces sp. M19]